MVNDDIFFINLGKCDVKHPFNKLKGCDKNVL